MEFYTSDQARALREVSERIRRLFFGAFEPVLNPYFFFLLLWFGCYSFGVKCDPPAAEGVEIRLLHEMSE